MEGSQSGGGGNGGALLQEKGSKAAPKLVLFGVSSTAVAGIWVLTFYLKPGTILVEIKDCGMMAPILKI